MRKINIFAAALIIMVAASSCENENNINQKTACLSNDLFMQMQENFNKIDITNIYDNYSLSKSELSTLDSLIREKNLIGKSATKIHYGNGCIAYSFKLSDVDYLHYTILVLDNTVIKTFETSMYETVTSKELIIAYNEQSIENYSFSPENNLLSINGRPVFKTRYAGNCDLLGPRVEGEDYKDCFERNLDNFCCDNISCIALYTNPHLIILSIALICAC